MPLQGYIVEYGGQSGDPDVFSSITGTTTLDLLQAVELSGSISVCPNLSGVSYTATGPTRSYISMDSNRWGNCKWSRHSQYPCRLGTNECQRPCFGKSKFFNHL